MSRRCRPPSVSKKRSCRAALSCRSVVPLCRAGAYLGEASDGAADGGAVSGHHGPVDQRLRKLGHAAHVHLLVGDWFLQEAYGGGRSKSEQTSSIDARKATRLRSKLRRCVCVHAPPRTCLGNDGRVLAGTRLLTQAAVVLAVDAEHVFVTHDQVGGRAVCPSVVLVDGEPFLRREDPIRIPTHRGRRSWIGD